MFTLPYTTETVLKLTTTSWESLSACPADYFTSDFRSSIVSQGKQVLQCILYLTTWVFKLTSPTCCLFATLLSISIRQKAEGRIVVRVPCVCSEHLCCFSIRLFCQMSVKLTLSCNFCKKFAQFWSQTCTKRHAPKLVLMKTSCFCQVFFFFFANVDLHRNVYCEVWPLTEM